MGCERKSEYLHGTKILKYTKSNKIENTRISKYQGLDLIYFIYEHLCIQVIPLSRQKRHLDKAALMTFWEKLDQ